MTVRKTIEIHEFVDEGLGHSSYLVELGDGTAAVIDPPRFPTDHERTAASHGLTIAWTVDTHSHADYVTGSPALASRTGATFVAPAASALETKHRPVVHGERVELGAGVSIVALASPGHTPDHHMFRLDRDGSPVALFSGGSVMVGTVGRTDLCGPGLAVPMARAMFRSLRDRLASLPDDLPVYPTHGAGSFCSAPGSTDRTTTLGRERATNPLLRTDDEDLFVERLLEGFGTFPTHFTRLPELNRHGPRRYDAIPTLPRLDSDSVRQHQRLGALVVDARPIAAFAAGHVPGSLSNALRPVFSSWLGWVVEPDRALVFVIDPSQDESDLVRQCLDVALENLAGVLDGGIDAWTAAGLPTTSTPLVVGADPHGIVVDVRQRREFLAGHVPGAVNVELGELTRTKLPGGPVTTMCGHGERAMTAASLLEAGGHDVSVFDGGPDDWASAAALPLRSAG